MSDQTTTISAIKQIVKQFVEERKWNIYHLPKNVSMLITIESIELLEAITQNMTNASTQEQENHRIEVEHETADVFVTILSFANACSIDMMKAFTQKLVQDSHKADASYELSDMKAMTDEETTIKQCTLESLRLASSGALSFSYTSGSELALSLVQNMRKLMEIFQWCSVEESWQEFESHKKQVEYILATQLVYIVLFADLYSIDLSQAVVQKMEHNRAKYPADLIDGTIENARMLKKKFKEKQQ